MIALKTTARCFVFRIEPTGKYQIMYCYQCEQTTRTGDSLGCSSSIGNCGKNEETSDLQDTLIHAVKGIAQYNKRARALGCHDAEASAFILRAMFSTLTNVNFNPARFTQMLQEASVIRSRLKSACENAAASRGEPFAEPKGPAAWAIPSDPAEMVKQAGVGAVQLGLRQLGDDIVGLRALVLYGCKGVCAYAHHALMLGQQRPEVFFGIENALDFLANNPTSAEELLGQALALGSVNLKVMEILDAGNTQRFGAPEPSSARTTPVAGKAILVSGHDLADLAALLEQSKGTGVNIYTHGEMLPAHGYPKLKQYPHLVANYGGAWQNQQTEFAQFPGPILMTSNCIIEPAPTYRRRIFTAGPVGWPGVRHIEGHDYSAIIQAAKAMPGFRKGEEEENLTVGFGHAAVLGVGDKVIDAVKAGAIKHFFLVGGCDGAIAGRNYYTEFVEKTPKDTVVLTLGCAKYRFNKQELGDIGGIPRLLDLGQCNDSYSAIQIAVALAEAFDCEVNALPLTLVVSWFEQKAAAVLLSLLALGIKGIRLGPTLPAFITPAVLDKLVETFDLKANTTPEADLAEALAG